MLRKLLKYDLKWIYQLVIIFYILAIVFSLLGRGFNSIQKSFIFNLVGQICNGIAIAMMINIIINSLMRIWVRFRTNAYKDEAYLTHTLPVKKQTIFLSKALAAIITMFTSFIVVTACLAICYYSKENTESLKKVLEGIAFSYDSNVISFVLEMIIILFLEFLFAIFAGYLGIILGHKSNNLKTLKSVIVGFALFTIPSIISLLVIFITGLFNPQIMKLFNESANFDSQTIKILIYLGIGLYLIYITIYYLIGNRQFKKGVNID